MRGDHDQRPVGEADVLPAQRAQLALAQPGEPGDGVDRGVLLVGESLLDVLLGARPSPPAVHVLAGSRRSRERQHLLSGERLGRLGVVLAALVCPPHRVRWQRERIRARRVLEHVHQRLTVSVDAPPRQSLAVEPSQEPLDLGGGDLGDPPLPEGAHDSGQSRPASPPPLTGR